MSQHGEGVTIPWQEYQELQHKADLYDLTQRHRDRDHPMSAEQFHEGLVVVDEVGNGVVPQQAEAAIRWMLAHLSEVAA